MLKRVFIVVAHDILLCFLFLKRVLMSRSERERYDQMKHGMNQQGKHYQKKEPKKWAEWKLNRNKYCTVRRKER